MAVKIVKSKDLLLKDRYNGAIREQTILAFPQDKSPLKQYSNLFYWSHLSSNYGCIIPEHSHIGFEIINYALKGSFETYQKEKDIWTKMNEGDMELVKAGKGIRHTVKLHPRSEILQIWIDPNFDQFRKKEAEIIYCKADSFPMNELTGIKTSNLGSKDSPLKFDSKGVSIELNDYSAGFHTIACPSDSVLSCYILDGYVEVNDITIGKNDFFTIDESKEIRIASLVNSRIFMTITPYTPEYKTYGSMYI